MKNYIFAENLKHKHSFLKKLLIISPTITILNAFVLMPSYFSVNAYNWWYVMLMPATLALIPAMMHKREDRNLRYRAIYPLNINLSKVWYSKIFTAVIYFLTTVSLHMLGVFLIQFLVGNQLVPNYRLSTLILASFILMITNIWQIPLCFFLAKKIGFISSVVGNTVLGFFLGILFANGTNWIVCPYSWGIRLMVPVLKILPNGVPIEIVNATMNATLLLPCLLSIFLFIVLSIISAKWFSKQEVK